MVFGLLALLIPIGVFAQNEPPVANDDSALAPKNTSVAINIVGNDNDPGGALNLSSVTVTTASVNGGAVSHGDGTITLLHQNSRHLPGDEYCRGER